MKLYLVIIEIYHDEENSIVNICSNYDVALELKKEYEERAENMYSYRIDEIDTSSGKDILWDCYSNSNFINFRNL